MAWNEIWRANEIFFPILNEDASDVIWPFAVWNAIFLSKREKKKNEEKVWNSFIQRK